MYSLLFEKVVRKIYGPMGRRKFLATKILVLATEIGNLLRGHLAPRFFPESQALLDE